MATYDVILIKPFNGGREYLASAEYMGKDEKVVGFYVLGTQGVVRFDTDSGKHVYIPTSQIAAWVECPSEEE